MTFAPQHAGVLLTATSSFSFWPAYLRKRPTFFPVTTLFRGGKKAKRFSACGKELLTLVGDELPLASLPASSWPAYVQCPFLPSNVARTMSAQNISHYLEEAGA